MADVAGAIGSLSGVTAGDKAVFVVQQSTGSISAVYAFTDDGSAGTVITAGELDLLTTVDANITNTDLNII